MEFSRSDSLPSLPAPPSPRQLLSECLKQKLLPLFAFDLDGTLVRIASTPEDVVFDPVVRRHLEEAARRLGRLVICSGRALRDLEVFFPGDSSLDLMGNHGFEWRIAKRNGFERREYVPPEWQRWRKECLPIFYDQIASVGGRLEDKGASVTIHYRESGRDWWASPSAVDWLARHVLAPARLVSGNTAWNVLPGSGSKGEFLVAYAKEFGFDALAYFGDEPTDESVFSRREMPVVGIRVGQGPTAARYRLRDVAQVHDWLTQLSMLESGLT